MYSYMLVTLDLQELLSQQLCKQSTFCQSVQAQVVKPVLGFYIKVSCPSHMVYLTHLRTTPSIFHIRLDASFFTDDVQCLIVGCSTKSCGKSWLLK